MNMQSIFRELQEAEEEKRKALEALKKADQELEFAKREAEKAVAKKEELGKDVDEKLATLATELQRLEMEERETKEKEEVEIIEEEEIQTHVEYFIEELGNIGCYHCYLQFQEPIKLKEAQIKLLIKRNFIQVEIQEDKKPKQVWKHIFEKPIDQGKSTYSVQPDHLNIRLAIEKLQEETVRTETIADLTHISSDELQPRNYSQCKCRFCDAVWLHDKITRVLPLPSSNWSEMLEFWGAGAGSFEHLPRGDIEADATRCYVGETRIMLHKSDIDPEAFLIEKASDGSATISCKRCKVQVGSCGSETSDTLTLQKHLISASNAESTEASESLDVFADYSVEDIILSDMLEVADSSGCFRFELCPEKVNDGDDKLLVQLMSWDGKITSNKIEKTTCKVVKVMYSCQKVSAEEQTSILLRHALHYSRDIITEVLERLNKSAFLLPPSMRKTGRLGTGFFFIHAQ